MNTYEAIKQAYPGEVDATLRPLLIEHGWYLRDHAAHYGGDELYTAHHPETGDTLTVEDHRVYPGTIR